MTSAPAIPDVAKPLGIAAFRDFSFFLLEADLPNCSSGFDAVITYVNDAKEAHQSLRNKTAELVFMSYDDTLSMVFEENDPEVRAVLPVHGGMLTLCGHLDLGAGKRKIGIDTDTGYARALRYYLQNRYTPQEYQAFEWQRIGATNWRYDKLLAGEVDATLLNPPYSYKAGIAWIVNLSDAVGEYQGVVVNANQSWLKAAVNRERLQKCANTLYERVWALRSAVGAATAAIQTFYGLSLAEAAAIYERLWQPDGLSLGADFDLKKLEGTEKIFAADTGIAIAQTKTGLRPSQNPLHPLLAFPSKGEEP